MTELHLSATVAPGPAAQPRKLRADILDTLRLAWPMALTQLGQIAMMTTDLVLLGRLGDKVMAAASLAHTILFAMFVIGAGLVSAVAPLAAQAFGARDPQGVRAALRVGLWVCAVAGGPVTLLTLFGYDMLVFLGQTDEAARLAARYLHGLAWSLAPGWAFIAIRGFMGAVNRPEPALTIMLAAVPVNALLAYGLIYGAFGLPRLDLLGAGIATTIVNVAMLVAALWVCVTQRPFKKYAVLGDFWRCDGALMRRLLVIGFPISATFFLEYGLFGGASLLVGMIGVTELAAHQIALQTAAVIFMAPFGISMAATVRVGQALGRGDKGSARRAGFIALGLALAFMCGATLLIVLTRQVIPQLFLGFSSPAAETLALASTLLLVAASFFIFDGLQTVGAGALRGLNDTRVPFYFALFSFWGVGFPAAWALGFTLGYATVGVWIGLTLSLIVYAVLLVWRFERLTRPAGPGGRRED
ncbi:MAG: MATE family efflux transporter [Beijerinckiaceae bacterium]